MVCHLASLVLNRLDQVRQTILDYPQGLQGVLSVISRLPATSAIAHTAGAVLLNAGMDFDPIKKHLVDISVFASILKFIDVQLLPQHDMVVGIAARLCGFLAEQDDGMAALKTQPDVASRLVNVLMYFMDG